MFGRLIQSRAARWMPLGAGAALFSTSPAHAAAVDAHARSYSDGQASKPPRLIVSNPGTLLTCIWGYAWVTFCGHHQSPPLLTLLHADAFARKWRKFVADGPAKLLVISDFDQTLTPFYKPGSGGRAQEPSSHGLLLAGGALSESVAARERELFSRYFPIEMSPKLTKEEKLPFMVEWWTQAHELLVESRLTRAHIREAVALAGLSFRPGFHALLALLSSQQIPTLVFSAGLYDVIHEVLRAEFRAALDADLPPNVHVVSNMMRFAADGTIEGFQGNLIHSINKNAGVVRDSPFWRQCQGEQRSNVLLLGDSRGDVMMAHGLDSADDDDRVIRVGFLNVHVEDALDEYLALYDVVLTHDASLEPVVMLLEQLAAQPPAVDAAADADSKVSATK